MKTHNTRRIYKVRCKGGLMGWRARLCVNYPRFGEWDTYSKVYGLAAKLGYADEKEAWDANPVIEGSTNPSDFRKVKA